MTTKLLYVEEKDSWVIYTDDLEELKKHLEEIPSFLYRKPERLLRATVIILLK